MNCRTQEQITEKWNLKDPCVVSVVCTTYNHEEYVVQAIESFLHQETNFPFEIILHDDASTDNTPKIIKKYHLRYPDIIIPIFQKANLYVKGIVKPTTYAINHSKGKYIALCEGDDYWIDSQKLQLQLDAMQKHPEIDFSFHSAYCEYNGVRDRKELWNYGYDQIFFYDSILKSGGFAPTASYMFSRELFVGLPAWFFETAPVGDFFLEMYGAQKGGGLYINRPMSVYRRFEHNSWTSDIKKNAPKRMKHLLQMLNSLKFLKNDFPADLSLFRPLESSIYYGLSICCLQTYDDKIFKENIKNSVNLGNFLSIKHFIVYIFRFFPNLLRMLIKTELPLYLKKRRRV